MVELQKDFDAWEEATLGADYPKEQYYTIHSNKPGIKQAFLFVFSVINCLEQ